VLNKFRHWTRREAGSLFRRRERSIAIGIVPIWWKAGSWIMLWDWWQQLLHTWKFRRGVVIGYLVLFAVVMAVIVAVMLHEAQ
jgi:hypothetical protein